MRGPFGDALAEVDWIVGNLVAKLGDLQLMENTLILFTGDHPTRSIIHSAAM